MKRNYLILFYLIVLLISTIKIPQLNASPIFPNGDSGTEDQLPKGTSIYQLDNGMYVLLIENPASPMVGANVAIKVGSAYETFSTSGMSHMLEHLLFNGTTTRDQKQLYDDVDLIGGYNNAHTDNYYTDFMMVVPVENTKKGMEIQADMLFNSTLPEEKFEKEKGIVLEEISKSLANPSEQFNRNTISVLYPGHALSLPTLGTYSTIQLMNRDDVNLFYRNYYVPNNMILSVIGNFNSKSMLEMIKEIYGKAIPGTVNYPIDPEWGTGFQHPENISENTSQTYFRFYDGTEKVIQMFYEIPQNRSEEYYQLSQLVLDSNKDTLQSLVKSEFANSIKSLKFSTRLSPIKNYVEATVTLINDIDLNALSESLSEKLSGLSFVLSEETVQYEATKARTEIVRNIEKPHMFGIYYSNTMVLRGVESSLSSYNENHFFKAAKDLETLKITSKPVILVQSPSLKTEVGDNNQNKIIQFKDDVTGKNLIVVQNELSNLLAIHYLIKHKAVYESKYGKDAAQILHDCLGQRLDSPENQILSSQFGFTFTVNDNPMIPMDNIYLHPDFGYIRVEGLADDLPGAIAYFNNVLNDFVPTEAEFEAAVEKLQGMGSMMRGDEAKKLFDTEYKTLVYEPDNLTNNQPELTYENLLEFTKVYFQPSNMIISVVSPGSPRTIDSLFNSLNFVEVTDEPAVYTPTFLTKNAAETIDKQGGGERSYLFYGFIKDIDPKDAPALQVLSLVLSDNIIFDIREKQGMAYHMSAGIEISENKALFFINQGTRPQNVDILVPQYPGFFSRQSVDTLTQNIVEKSINMYLGRMMFRRLSGINQAFYLGSSEYFFNAYDHDRMFLDEVKKITLADVKSVAEKYMKIDNPMTLIVR